MKTKDARLSTYEGWFCFTRQVDDADDLCISIDSSRPRPPWITLEHNGERKSV